MELTRLEKIYTVIIAVIFGGIILHAPLSVGFGVLFPDYSLLIKSWKELLMLGLIPLAVIIVSKRRLWREFAHDWVFRIIVAYTVLHLLIAAVLYQGMSATAAGLAIDLRYILFFGLVYVLVKVAPASGRLLLRIGVIGAAVVVGFATLQLFLPPDILKYVGYNTETIAPYLTVDNNPDYVRVNSTLRGPNPLGAYAVIALALLAAFFVRYGQSITRRSYAIGLGLLALCSLIALWVSYSRSALVAGIICVAIVLAITIARRLSRKAWTVIAISTAVLIGGLAASQNSSFVSHVLLHEDPSDTNAINSNDGHFESLQDGLNRMIRQPLGAGVGSTGSASLHSDTTVIIENQYLFIAHETGWLGLLLFLTLFSMLLRRLWVKRSYWLSLGVFAGGIGLALIGLLLPVWVDDTVAIIWWGLAAIALGGGEYDD